MKLDVRADRSTIVVGTSLGLLAILLMYVLFHFLSLRAGYAEQIDSIQPRTARLLGMLESVDELGTASGKASAILGNVAYATGRDRATAAAALQRDVREIMASSGLTVTGSHIQDARSGDGYDLLQLDVTAEGNVQALDDALVQLEEMRPLVFVETLKIKPIRTRRRGSEAAYLPEDPRKLNARFNLFALRLQN